MFLPRSAFPLDLLEDSDDGCCCGWFCDDDGCCCAEEPAAAAAAVDTARPAPLMSALAATRSDAAWWPMQPELGGQ